MNRFLKNGTVLLLSSALTAAQFSTVFADNADNNASENQTESSMQEDMEQTPSKEASSDDVRKGSGEMDGQRPEGQPPEMPNGEKPDGQPPEMSNDDNPPEKPDGEKPDGPGQMGGGESGGESRVSGRLSEDAVWNVTETSLISSLSIEDDAQVVIPENVTLTVDGTEYSGCTLTSEDI